MMKIENSLAATDLNQFKKQPLELLVKQIYKHQNFKNKVILDKINRLNFTENTVKCYIVWAKSYLKNNIRKSNVPARLFEILDELKAKHEGILTPSEQDKANEYTKRSPQPKPQITVETPKTTDTTPRQYGVKIQNTIKLFPSKDACLGYIECYRELGRTEPAAIVSVSIKYN